MFGFVWNIVKCCLSDATAHDMPFRNHGRLLNAVDEIFCTVQIEYDASVNTCELWLLSKLKSLSGF